MTAKSKVQSIEPNIADMANSWLKSYELDYKLEQESLNTEIDQALNDYFSKNGGKGGNRPDAKLLLRADDGKYYPILIEYKGYEDKLVKLDSEGNVANKNAKNQPDFANINSLHTVWKASPDLGAFSLQARSRSVRQVPLGY